MRVRLSASVNPYQRHPHTHVQNYVHIMWMCAQVGMCAWRPEGDVRFLPQCPPYFFRQYLSLSLELMSLAGLAGQQTPGISQFPSSNPQHWEYGNMLPHLVSSSECQDPNQVLMLVLSRLHSLGYLLSVLFCFHKDSPFLTLNTFFFSFKEK